MNLPKLNLHDPKTQVGLAGAGGVVAFALYKRHQAAAGGATSATTTTAGQDAAAALDAASIESNISDALQPQIDSISSQLSGVKATPGPAGPAGPPGAAGKSAPPATGPTAAHTYATVIPKSGLPGNPLVALGTITGADTFTGQNVRGGAPVYAIEGNRAVQNFDPRKLPKGTVLATLKSFAGSIVPGKVTEKL